jgi:hypothetical protein
MNASIIATSASSRPKIHRRPAFLAHKAPEPIAAAPRRPYVPSAAVVSGTAFLALLMVAFTLKHEDVPAPPPVEQGVLTISVPILPPSPVEVTARHVAPEPPSPSLSSGMISDAQASVPNKPMKTIRLQGESEMIVGQMAHIPADNEQITEIKAVSDIDNGAGRELLSIISKY